MKEPRWRIIIFLGEIFILVAFINHLFAKENNTEDVMGRPHVEYKAEDLRDPFRFSKEKEEPKKQILSKKIAEKPLPTLTIQGIVWGGTLPQAIINEKVVKVGDKIEEAQIIDISKDGVTVFFDNREYKLSSPATLNLQSLKPEPKGGKYEE